MTLEEALAASPIGAASIPAVGDIVYFRDGTTFWWLQDAYVNRGRPPGPHVLESDEWHPFEDAERLPKEYHGT